MACRMTFCGLTLCCYAAIVWVIHSRNQLNPLMTASEENERKQSREYQDDNKYSCQKMWEECKKLHAVHYGFATHMTVRRGETDQDMLACQAPALHVPKSAVDPCNVAGGDGIATYVQQLCYQHPPSNCKGSFAMICKGSFRSFAESLAHLKIFLY